ncbi:carbon-nitrogen family hydrolase [Desulfotalea psychrophila]|uniref:CN hydrolase domain-containing protein n=1 Tax=Desulfotalea psychrophila (strain LSv54 / DSM 12343) TaxID=177439 RepID=Q6AMZ4_DESPS|nr:carbon-nitrogen family hydrolase [Desulfotalea psychrophila]CAG36280.1 conserved hypothetical protein [Desulfotalea psychrophila LSv54]
MKISAIQLAVVEDDKAASIARARTEIELCRESDLIILPEIWNTGFMNFAAYRSLAEERKGPTLSMVREMAVKTSSFIHSGSFVEKIEDKYYNSSYLISPDGDILGNYRKIHLFGFASLETEILSAGQEISVINTKLGIIGMATCFDLRFPELFRKMVDQGTEIFLICAAWPLARLADWALLNRVRALENQALLISANARGMSKGVQLAGNSMIVGPNGQILAQADDMDNSISAEINLNAVKEARCSFPALSSRKTFLN